MQLVRLPNIFTAVADPLAGALAVGATVGQTVSILSVMAASACIYAGGIVLNDWHDYRQDLRERPHRPLPSGRISRWRALIVAITLFVAGLGLVNGAGKEATSIAGLLVIAVLLYDVLLKDLPIAPAIMGICRGLNLFMGMMVVTASPGSAAPVSGMRPFLVLIMWAYILGVTAFARREALLSEKNRLIAGAGIALVAAASLLGMRVFFPGVAVHISGEVLVLLLLGGIGWRMMQAVLKPEPRRVQAAVKTAIMGIIVLDASMVAMLRDWPASLLVLVLLIPAVWLGRWLYST